MTARKKAAVVRATRAKPGEELSRARSRRQRYLLRLYVAGMRLRSIRAIANIKEICEEYLKGRYDLQVIDLYQQGELAVEEQIIALPTLIRKLPPPLRRLIGDLSDRDQVLIALDLRPSRGRKQPRDDERATAI